MKQMTCRQAGKLAQKKLREKYGDDYKNITLRGGLSCAEKRRRTLTQEERSNRARLIRYKIPFSHLKPSEYGQAISDYKKSVSDESVS